MCVSGKVTGIFIHSFFAWDWGWGPMWFGAQRATGKQREGSQVVTGCFRCEDGKKAKRGPQRKASGPAQEDFLKEILVKE